MTTKGSCLCGAIQYEFTGEPVITALCHCTNCQKWTGSAFTTSIVVPRTSFTITQDAAPLALKSYDVAGDSGKTSKIFFCGTCGSSLYTELEVMPEVVCIKAGGLDGGMADLGRVDVEFYTRSRVCFVKEVDGARQETVFG